MDPLSIRKKYANAQDASVQDSFYTNCASIPITLILGVLFYSLWYISPKSQNLRMYQQDIFDWNSQHVADKMAAIELEFQILPSKQAPKFQKIDWLDKPMSFEKDEIALRNKYFYKQSYFYRAKALKEQGIEDVLWIENNIDSIVNKSAQQTQQDRDTVYSSQTYCLNINYRLKNQNT